MTAPSELPLAGLAKGDLEALRKAIAQRRLPMPLTQAGLGAIGRGALFAKLGPLAGASHEAALALIDLALAVREAGNAGPARPEAVLVWSGPEVKVSTARPTTAMLLELLGGAQTSVLISGYVFDHGRVIFAPLHQAMRDRGVKVTICLDVPPAAGAKMELDAHLALRAHQFLAENWPFGPPLPELLYWGETCVRGTQRSLHAKCVVVDRREVLIGSANFTRRGHTRNVEVGVRIVDAALAGALVSQFQALRGSGELRVLPVATGRLVAPPVAAEDEADGIAAVGVEDETTRLAAELLVTDAARPLFARVLGSGLPVPAVGEDVEGDDGAVIGSPELTWEVPRVAVLLPEQEGSRKQLEAAGWTCFAVALDQAAFDALAELIRRGG